jgi:hypothetical protein
LKAVAAAIPAQSGFGFFYLFLPPPAAMRLCHTRHRNTGMANRAGESGFSSFLPANNASIANVVVQTPTESLVRQSDRMPTEEYRACIWVHGHMGTLL